MSAEPEPGPVRRMVDVEVLRSFINVAANLSVDALREFDPADPELAGWDEELKGRLYAYSTCLSMIEVAALVSAMPT